MGNALEACQRPRVDFAWQPLIAAAERVLPPLTREAGGAVPGRASAAAFIGPSGEALAAPCALVLTVPGGGGGYAHVLCFNTSAPLAARLAALAAQGSPRAAEAAEALWVTGRWPHPGVGDATHRQPLTFTNLALGSMRLWLSPLGTTGPSWGRLTLPLANNPVNAATWAARDEAIAADVDGGDDDPVAPEQLGDRLIMWSPALLWLTAGVSADRLLRTDRLAALSWFFRTPLVDRTGVLSDGFALRVSSRYPIPPRDPAMRGAPIAALMGPRAREVLAAADERRLQLCCLWSGGIDSTAVLCSLLAKLRRSAPRPRPIVVLISQASVEEYPWFYDKVITPAAEKGELTIERMDEKRALSQQLDLSQRLYVTGECGDQLFGSDMMQHAFAEHKDQPHLRPFAELGLDAPWEQTVPVSLGLLGFEPDRAAWKDWIAPQLACAPFPIVSTFDLLWWLNFSMKWQHVCLRCFHLRSEVTEADLRGIVHFYATDEFQQWSMENHDAKLPDKAKWATYKAPLKSYIFDFTGDAEYRDTKLKWGSLAGVMNPTEGGLSLALDDRLNTISCGFASLSPSRLRARYGDALRRFVAPHVQFGQPADPVPPFH
eukprot:TRINITY_DN37230_c0_g1_i1.p1 TRINITY_DN37230_c0_g1~~TRINITY_DN37230_c0_g1_i1.p1  ORF type:complete len:603 (+),score=132.28 TRINITY_DN37230_c0_g1_i1:75-1883(+)